MTRYQAAQRALQEARDAHYYAVEEARSPQQTTGKALRKARAARIEELATHVQEAKARVEWLRTHPSGDLRADWEPDNEEGENHGSK